MKKFIVSLILAISLLLNSCASIRVNGVEINKETQVEVNNEDIIAWTVLITACGVFYVGVPLMIMGGLSNGD